MGVKCFGVSRIRDFGGVQTLHPGQLRFPGKKLTQFATVCVRTPR